MNGWMTRSGPGDPWRQMRWLQREMNRLLGQFAPARAAALPAVNVWTNDEGAVVTAELPGVKGDDLDITAAGQTLTIRGERRADQPKGDWTWHRRERRVGSFGRSLDLPFQIDPDKVEANYRDGVLEVRVGRAESDKPRKIAVKS
jgi:HSP20 family protein